MKHITFNPTFHNQPFGPREDTFIKVAEADVNGLTEAAIHYGESWYKRDGAGAFFMLARKWDRLENRLASLKNYSILDAIKGDQRAEGIIDDIRDLRRYLILVEAKALELGFLPGEVAKGDKVAIGGDLHKKSEEEPQRLGPYCDALQRGVDQLNEQLDKAEKFKNFVHSWLDSQRVPMNPAVQLGETAGCRIGRRLRWLKELYEERLAEQRGVIERLQESSAKLRERIDELMGYNREKGVITVANGMEQADHKDGPWEPLTPGEVPSKLYLRQEQGPTAAQLHDIESAEEYRIFKDGDRWCAVGPGFRNLQEDPAGFGPTPHAALANLP